MVSMLKKMTSYKVMLHVYSSYLTEISSRSRNLSEEGPDDSQNLQPTVVAIFLLTSFNRGRGAWTSVAPLGSATADSIEVVSHIGVHVKKHKIDVFIGDSQIYGQHWDQNLLTDIFSGFAAQKDLLKNQGLKIFLIDFVNTTEAVKWHWNDY